MKKELTVDEFSALVAEYFSRRAAKLIFNHIEEVSPHFEYNSFDPNDWDEYNSLFELGPALGLYDLVDEWTEEAIQKYLECHTLLLNDSWEELEGGEMVVKNLYVIQRF